MDRIINWELLSHPYNWIIVILMLAIGTIGLRLIPQAFSGSSNLT